MKLFGIFLIRISAIALAAWLLPGVTADGFWPIFWLVIVLAPIDLIIKPVIQLFSLPITILTLGLFALFINGLFILLAAALVPGFAVDGLFTAILFSILLSLTTMGLDKLFMREKGNKKERNDA